MTKKLFVGGLAWSTTDETLRAHFEPFGQVEHATVIRDRDTGRSRGFGFVEMKTEEEAETAKSNLNETELDGRRVRVDDTSERGGGGGGGGSGGFQQPVGRWGTGSYSA